jgi:ParB family transcriptional regulator, chromosome partitioning protein
MSGLRSQRPTSPARAEHLIAIDRIAPNPDQPRRSFPEDALDDLAASIREKGIIQPLILRADPRRPDGFQIVAGERRWRAAQRAQLHEVPAIVRDLDDTEVLEVAIIENIQRADLNPVEEASELPPADGPIRPHAGTLAEALGKSRSHIANMLRLLNLAPDTLALLRDGKITTGHARALLTAQDPSALARRIVDEGLSVRETERLAKEPPKDKGGAGPKGKGRAAEKDADTRDARERSRRRARHDGQHRPRRRWRSRTPDRALSVFRGTGRTLPPPVHHGRRPGRLRVHHARSAPVRRLRTSRPSAVARRRPSARDRRPSATIPLIKRDFSPGISSSGTPSANLSPIITASARSSSGVTVSRRFSPDPVVSTWPSQPRGDSGVSVATRSSPSVSRPCAPGPIPAQSPERQ